MKVVRSSLEEKKEGQATLVADFKIFCAGIICEHEKQLPKLSDDWTSAEPKPEAWIECVVRYVLTFGLGRIESKHDNKT